MAQPKLGKSANPGAFLDYISSTEVGGFQLPTRYGMNITRKDRDDVTFLCSMAQIPSNKISTYPDHLSGSVSPLPIPYMKRMNSNIFEFVIEGSWSSRKYFEDWKNSIFHVQNGQRSKVNYFEDCTAQIFITALSTKGDISTYFRLDDCIPVQIIPTKMDGSALNTPLKFSVDIMYGDYYTPT